MTLTASTLTNKAFFTFGGSTALVNFASGWTGSLSLWDGGTANATTSEFNTYIADGNIEIDGTLATSLSQFTETSVDGYDIYSIASVPKLSTWAMLLGGIFALLFLQRRNRLTVLK